MISFTATILKYDEQGEKTGWTYIEIPKATAHRINPSVKKSYRVKGRLDDFPIEQVALVPVGNGNFIMAINAAMRKGIGKRKGATVQVSIEKDDAPIQISTELLDCLSDEPSALEYFNKLPQSHRNYFTKWIDSAKTDATRTKRIVLVVKTMLLKMDFGAMLRAEREERKALGK